MSADVAFHPIANLFPLIEGEEFDALVDDVRQHGLREPVVLYQGQILDGRNRYRACVAAESNCRFQTYEGTDPAGYVVSLNLRRRHLNESQRAMVAAKLANMPQGARTDLAPIGARSQSDAGKLLNVSRRTVQRASEVTDAAVPELASKVEQGSVSVSAAADIASLSPDQQREIVARGEREILQRAKEIRAKKADASRAERIERIAKIAQGNRELGTDDKYPVLLADPPWRFENPPIGNSVVENHYPTLSLDEICALPVSDLATEDAILYMWATAPNLPGCLQVVAAWGFEYRTNLVWVKQRPGMGYHARGQHELLLVARRGNIPPPAATDTVSSVIFADLREPSRKPEKVRDIIERYYPDLTED